MKAKKNRRLVVWVAALSAVVTLGRVDAAEADGWWKNFEIGTRSTYFWIRDDKRGATQLPGNAGNYYGSINELVEVEDPWPLKIFVDYKINPYWGVELTWDQIKAKTYTQVDPTSGWGGYSDGTLSLIGPEASVFARYPNDTIFTPYAGVGAVYYFASNTENGDWAHPYGDFYQAFDPNNTWGWVFYGGCAIPLSGPWSADLFVRYTKVGVDGTHYQGFGAADSIGGQFTFPLSNVSAGLGVRYSF